MPTVDQIVADVLRREGGYVDDPNDAGGTTNYGISLRYAKGVGLDLDGDKDVDGEDIRLVTPAVAAQCFKDDFLRAPGIDKLPVEIVPLVFDCAVNHGPPQAVKFVQRVLVDAQIMPAVSDRGRPQDDGVIGPATIAAAAQAQAKMGALFNDAIVIDRLAFYEAIIRRKPDQAKFRKGWRSRAMEFALNPKLVAA